MSGLLEGKVAAVTGSASGIGLASAEAMIAEGARVVFVDYNEAALANLVAKHGGSAIPLAINLLDADECASMMPRILDQVGQLDIFHANAGLYVGGDLLENDRCSTRVCEVRTAGIELQIICKWATSNQASTDTNRTHECRS